ncbi:MAG TPA: glycosyltransferase [Bacteroidales bacterium]|nr:glycosyltransferase [Bacteroidales bacterium]
MTAFILALIFAYSLFVILILTGIWIILPKRTKPRDTKLPGVSVLIPFRNEAENLPLLIQDLLNQSYPKNKVELIFINDHSSDKGRDILVPVCHQTRHKFIDLPSEIRGKKAALKRGIENASHDVLITCDADCRMGRNWLYSMLEHSLRNQSDMVLGPVVLRGNGFAAFQAAESLSLLAVSMGSAGLGEPVLSNGANLLFRKQDFMAYEDPHKQAVSSGDDIFLMEKYKAEKKRISFNTSPEAVVTSAASQNLTQLIDQRIRWVSKTRHYTWGSSKLSAAVFGILQVGFLVSVPLLLFNNAALLGYLFGFKLLYDNLVVLITARVYRVGYNPLSASVLSLLYPLWTLGSGVLSFTRKAQWKGRPVVN